MSDYTEETSLEEEGPMLVTLEDELGEEHEFELIDRIDHEDSTYYALVSTDEETQDEIEEEMDDEILILKLESGELGDEDSFLAFIEDDNEYEKISKLFMEQLAEDFDFYED